MIMLNMKSKEPIWEQIRDSFKKQIFSGVLGAGEQLPSVRTLASTLGINPNTIQRAYTELERAGLVYTVQGRGCFVAEKSEVSLELEKTERLKAFMSHVKELCEIGIDKKMLFEIIEKEYEDK